MKSRYFLYYFHIYDHFPSPVHYVAVPNLPFPLPIFQELFFKGSVPFFRLPRPRGWKVGGEEGGGKTRLAFGSVSRKLQYC